MDQGRLRNSRHPVHNEGATRSLVELSQAMATPNRLKERMRVKNTPSQNESSSAWKDMPKSVQTFLQLRGFSSYDEAIEFLEFPLKNLTDPLKLKDMDIAVARLEKAFTSNEAVCVYGDFDMDGTPAVALLVRALRGLGFKNVFHIQPDRHKDGYGFHTHLAKKMMDENKVTVFITVDVGITDVAAVREVNALGADVIITDHHQEKEELPQAFAVINPNQKKCNSGMGHLCGTGVALYVAMALNRHFRENKISEKFLDIKNLLDCFAIATIADLVPLKKENRVLVRHGLKVLEKTSMVGIQALLNLLKLSEKTLNAADVGIRFVPKLNSLTRMGGEILPIDLFLVENGEQALQLATRALEVNENRVRSLKTAEQELETLFGASETKNFFWSYSGTFHKGLVGLLASKVVNATQKTAFVGALLSDGKTIVGSARTANVNGNNVFEALTSCRHILKKFGGHPQAAGFELDVEQAGAFDTALAAYFSQCEERKNKPTDDAVDMEVTVGEAKEFLHWMDRLEPFGVGFTAPVFAFPDVILSEVKPLKGNHFRLTLRDQRGQSIGAILFGHNGEPPLEQHMYRVVGEPQWNEFRGNKTPQLMVKSFQLTDLQDSISLEL
jgi:single-stranded-DNA-specific exonuclease